MHGHEALIIMYCKLMSVMHRLLLEHANGNFVADAAHQNTRFTRGGSCAHTMTSSFEVDRVLQVGPNAHRMLPLSLLTLSHTTISIHFAQHTMASVLASATQAAHSAAISLFTAAQVQPGSTIPIDVPIKEDSPEQTFTFDNLKGKTIFVRIYSLLLLVCVSTNYNLMRLAWCAWRVLRHL